MKLLISESSDCTRHAPRVVSWPQPALFMKQECAALSVIHHDEEYVAELATVIRVYNISDRKAHSTGRTPVQSVRCMNASLSREMVDLNQRAWRDLRQ